MPPLHTLSTLRTPADGNVKTPHPRPAHDLFLILRFDPLQGQGTGARRTLCRNRHRNLLIHTLRDGPARMRSVAGARLAARGFSDDSCAGLAKTEPPDAGWRAARPPTLFASAQSLPAAAHFRSLDAACPAAPDPVAQGLAAAPAPVL